MHTLQRAAGDSGVSVLRQSLPMWQWGCAVARGRQLCSVERCCRHGELPAELRGAGAKRCGAARHRERYMYVCSRHHLAVDKRPLGSELQRNTRHPWAAPRAAIFATALRQMHIAVPRRSLIK